MSDVAAPMPRALDPAPSSRFPPWMPLLVVALAWLAQGGVLRNGWVWDDAILVRDGVEVARGFPAVPALLTGTWGGGSGLDVGLFRPLVGASLAVQAGLHGVEDPFPFHLVNLFLHGLVALLFLRLLVRVLPGRWVLASSAALLFAASPLHTGTVSWIVARGDLLAALFALAAAAAWTRPGGLDGVGAVLAATLWFLALLSKEMALTLPLALLVLDAATSSTSVFQALRRRAWAYGLLLVPLVAYLALRASATGSWLAQDTHAALAGRSLLERLFVGAGALVRMAWTILVPVGLSGDRGNDPVLAASAAIPTAYAVSAGLVVLGGLLVLFRRLAGRAGVGGAGLVLFVVLALPVLQLVPLGAVFEDRFAYLPSLALLPVVALAAERLARLRPRALGLAALALPLAALVPACWAVAADWRSEEDFDRALLAEDPGHLDALDRLALARLGEGLALRREALATSPTQARRIQALHRHASAAVVEAAALLERGRALPGGARHAGLLRTLADAYLALPTPLPEKAEQAYLELLALKRVRWGGRWVLAGSVPSVEGVFPKDRETIAQIQENLAQAEAGLAVDDRDARVAEALERAAIWDPPPGSYERQRRAGAAWMAAGAYARGVARLQRAAELAPVSERARAEAAAAEAAALRDDRVAQALRRAQEALERAGGHNAAAVAFGEALRLDPDHVGAQIGLARVLRYKGDLRGALEALAAATKSLDARRASAEDPDRRTVERLVAEYESAR